MFLSCKIWWQSSDILPSCYGDEAYILYKIQWSVTTRCVSTDDKNCGESDKGAAPTGQKIKIRGSLVDHLVYKSENMMEMGSRRMEVERDLRGPEVPLFPGIVITNIFIILFLMTFF